MSSEPIVRLTIFITLVVAFLCWEHFRPRRMLQAPRQRRWQANISLMLLDSLVVRVCFPLAAVGVAVLANNQSIGVLNLYSLHPVIAVVVAVIALDFLIYWQHRLMHRVPFLWRLHKVHHTDIDIDLSSGLRFHPVEILLSMAIKVALILLLGLNPTGVLAFEILLSSASLFTHSNIHIPVRIDQLVRYIIVTPDMHRIHHSVKVAETDRNYGFCLSCWDRLFSSYRCKPAQQHDTMALGLESYRDAQQLSFLYLLKLPFESNKSSPEPH